MRTCPACGRRTLSTWVLLHSSRFFPARCPRCGKCSYRLSRGAEVAREFLVAGGLFLAVAAGFVGVYWAIPVILWIFFWATAPLRLVGKPTLLADFGHHSPTPNGILGFHLAIIGAAVALWAWA